MFRLTVVDTNNLAAFDDAAVVVLAQGQQLVAVCGNSACEIQLGETLLSCPADCNAGTQTQQTNNALTNNQGQQQTGSQSGQNTRGTGRQSGSQAGQQDMAPAIQAEPLVESALGEDVEVKGIATDPEGGKVTYSWKQTGGPEVGGVSGNISGTLRFRPTKEGLYKFEVTAADANGNRSEPKVIIVAVGAGQAAGTEEGTGTGTETAQGWQGLLGGIIEFVHGLLKSFGLLQS